MAFLSRALLLAAGCLCLATPASAYELKRTPAGALVHWEEASVSYSIDPSVDAAVSGGASSTLSAMTGWSGEVGAPSLHGALAGADAPTQPGLDRKNGVFFVPGGYEPAGKALAITVLTYDNESGAILDADVVFNGAYAFAVLPTTVTDTAPPKEVVTRAAHETEADTPAAVQVRGTLSTYDLEHVVGHELGHSLGMNDERTLTSSLMYRYSAPNDPSVRAPAADDVDGLSELYAKSGAEGCGGATVAPKKPSSDAARVAMLGALGLVLFVLLRARKGKAAFVVAATAAVALLAPRLEGREAKASTAAAGHARAKVVTATTTSRAGMLRTTYALATTTCRTGSCPPAGHGSAWGGTEGRITQEINGAYAPRPGDEVDVSFDGLDTLAALQPLTGRSVAKDLAVRVVTKARQ